MTPTSKKPNKRLYYVMASALLALLAVCSCQRAAYRTNQGVAWGTTYHITYCAERDLGDSILTVIDHVNKSLSAFDQSSLVSALNHGDSVHADTMLARVFDLSQHICSISGGAFDPTLAPLINIWGFGYADGMDTQPSPATIDSALALVGIRQCTLGPDGLVTKKHPGTQFNFSAVAKGYGVDCIAAMLSRNGCRDYMVEVGGEIALQGRNPQGALWHIQLDAPVPGNSHERMRILELTDCGIATSGNYRNYRQTSDGKRWHTISPVTGYPAVTDILSATVIAPTAAYADALATALMAMPDSAAEALVATLPADIQVILIK